MTAPEAKAAILAQLNQIALNTIVDELAKAVVEIAELKAKLAAPAAVAPPSNP
jgi:hypothetical protein